MSKRSKPIIPPLRIDPIQERSTRDLMARMRGPQIVDAHTAQSGRLIEPVDAKAPTETAPVDAKAPTLEIMDAHTETSGRPQSADRHKAGRVRHHLRLPAEISERFRVFCAEKRIDFQEFVEMAGVHFLECGRPQSSEDVDAKTPHDDLKIFKTCEDIIRLYTELTGNRWRPADDQHGPQFERTDRRILEIGMLQTLLNFKGRRINSFAYFVPEIQQVEDLCREVRTSDAQIDGVLETRRRQWQGRCERV